MNHKPALCSTSASAEETLNLYTYVNMCSPVTQLCVNRTVPLCMGLKSCWWTNASDRRATFQKYLKHGYNLAFWLLNVFWHAIQVPAPNPNLPLKAGLTTVHKGLHWNLDVQLAQWWCYLRDQKLAADLNGQEKYLLDWDFTGPYSTSTELSPLGDTTVPILS